MRLAGIFLFFFIAFSAFGQIKGRLDEEIDRITYDWDFEADKLSTYEGLRFACTNTQYRDRIVMLLKEIHHYDTILFQVLTKLSKTDGDREIRQTLKEIQKFEEKYDTRSFIRFMHQECKASSDVERNVEVTKNDVRENSYSGQKYILETELYKYVRHVTHRVDKIRLHIHHLSSHY